MGVIRLEVLPWLSRAFDGQGVTRVVLEREVAKGTTIGDLLERLVADHPALGRILYDPGGGLALHVSVILNDRLFELAGGLEAPVRPGDIICLLPAFSGG
jgi:molybdopterin converting factor small subunit